MPWTNDTVDSNIDMKAMSFDEIVAFSRDNFDINVVKSDFNPVNQEKLVTIYISLLQALRPDMSSPMQIPFEALANIERTDEHEQFILLTNVFVTLKNFLGNIRFQDFEFEDIVAPKTKRTQIILSHIISFLCFCDSRVERSKQLESLLNETEKKREALAKMEPVLQRRKTNATVERVKAEQYNTELQQEFNECNAKLAVAIQEQDGVKKEAAAKKATVKQCEELKRVKSEMLTELQERVSFLESKIARSPEKLKAGINTSNKELARYKAEIQSQRAQLVTLQTKTKTIIANWKSKTKKTHDVIVAISEQLKLINSLATNKEVRYRGKELRRELADSQANLEDRETVLKAFREKWDTLTIQHLAKINAKKEILETTEKSMQQLLQRANENDIAVESFVKEMDELKIKILKNEEELKKLGEYPLEYHRLLKSFDVNNLKLAEVMDKLMAQTSALKPINFPKQNFHDKSSP